MIPEDRILAGSSDDKETDVVVVDGVAVVEVDAALEVDEHAPMSMVAAAKPQKIVTFLDRLTSTLFLADIMDAS
jgi:hypothetical protein